MRAAVILLLALIAVASAAPAMTRLSRSHADVAAAVNRLNTSWQATAYPRFANLNALQIKKLMGTFLGPGPVTLPVKDEEPRADVPTAFDSRTQWGQMCNSTLEIRDQADCGSCWAFGMVEAATDRICIHSNGTQKPHISAQDLNSCCTSCGSGCDGGYPAAAWQSFKTAGLVTGGNYGTKQGCMPYSLPNCAHHEPGPYPNCTGELPTPACTRKCEAGYAKTYTADKWYGATAYSIPANVAKIQTEIMTNGPVETSFQVYEDFLTYKSGVYVQTSQQLLGGHAVKFIGWGVESGVDYWIVANSWNQYWGDNGFFKIKRGVNECGIEEGVVAGMPKL